MTAIDAIEMWLAQPAAQAVGWALLHFLWQGALVGALAAGALAALRSSAADVRYVVATIAMSLMLTMPVVTFVQSWRAAATRAAGAAAIERPLAAEAAGPIESDAPASRPQTATFVPAPRLSPTSLVTAIRVEPWLPIFVLSWCCGVAVLTLRLMSGWLWVRRMRTYGTTPAEGSVVRMAARLSRRLHISRTITLLQSAIVDVPTVIGWIKPVVLLPASALAGLTPHQLEAILAHELAHIRRHDYLVNLLQTLVETLLFYHPAVWWLSRRIRAERENCCDDLAVSLCGDPYTYARALADLEELRGTGSRLVLAASGGSLLQRVRRLLGAPTHAGRGPGWLAGAVAVVLMFGLAAGAAGTDGFQAASTAVVAAPQPATAGVADRAAASVSQAATPAARRERPQAAARAAGEASRPTTAPTADALDRATTAQLAAADDSALAALSPSIAAEAATASMLAGLLPGAVDMGAAFAAAAARADAEMVRPLTADARTAAAVAGASTSTAAATARSVAQSSGTHIWSSNGEKVEIKYEGTFEFTDDDTDIRTLSPHGYLRIKDGGWLGSRSIEFTADGSGRITRRYWVGMSEKPFEPEGREWLSKMLPRFVRQSGIGAPARVARILKAKGPGGVLAEISLIEGSWAKRIYFTELLNTARLDQAAVRQALAQAGREITSDYELASLLIKSAQSLTTDDATRKAYFEAATSIKSDYELGRVLSSALAGTQLSPAMLTALLEASQSIGSDHEQASLLLKVAKTQTLDRSTRQAFFVSLGTVGSNYDHRRVLSALADRGESSQDTAVAMLESAGRITSDFETASFLLQIVTRQPIEGALRAPFFKAVEGLSSSFERGRVLQAVVKRGDASAETILATLKAARGMSGSHETSQVLLAIANGHSLSADARDAYIDAADKLGDYEQGRVLAALVKSERRKNP